ncbi:MAG: hypothetical protein ALECFALPRED_003407 [Alectoria fallacina]|uniref:Uncharacterized protein n=1 Tax=Alectoria fallacina TaxID=1903189 RepID=A0A8H3IFM9_9LECA|nr:MAG: hypothetical protein ALECFALPRED_003407 [Alectoria fallacina]
MACKSPFQVLTSKNPQSVTKEVRVTSLINGPQIQYHPSRFTVSASSALSDPSESQSAFRSIEELPKPCGFLTLATELCDIIYSELFTSGQVEILRVSRQLQPEVLKPITIPSNRKVQSFNILMSLPDAADIKASCSDRYTKLNPGFGRSVQGSGDCHITLLFRGSRINHMPVAAIKFIELLSTFKVFMLRIPIRHDLHSMDEVDGMVAEPSQTQTLTSVAASLPSILGCPAWKSDTRSNSHYPYAKTQSQRNPSPNAQYLEFHPRERRENAGGVNKNGSSLSPLLGSRARATL